MMRKTFLSVLLLCLMSCTAVLTGCGGGMGEIEDLELPEYGYFHRYEETVTLTIGQLVDKPNSYFGDEYIGMNAVYDLSNETLNADLQVKFSGSSTDISTQVKNNMYDDDLPDITQRFPNLDQEADRPRTAQSFLVPRQEIADNDYDLSINKYKKEEYVPVEYPPTKELMKDLHALEAEITAGLAELEGML